MVQVRYQRCKGRTAKNHTHAFYQVPLTTSWNNGTILTKLILAHRKALTWKLKYQEPEILQLKKMPNFFLLSLPSGTLTKYFDILNSTIYTNGWNYGPPKPKSIVKLWLNEVSDVQNLFDIFIEKMKSGWAGKHQLLSRSYKGYAE